MSARAPFTIGMAVGVLAYTGCIIDRGAITGTGGIDAFLEGDTGDTPDASRDARIGADAPIDAFMATDSGHDAFVPMDAGVDAATDAFTPFDTPQPDAFTPPDVFTPPDAFTPLDAFVPDAFVPPDAFRIPDAFVPPDAFTIPDAFTPPDAFREPDAYAPDAFVLYSDMVAWWPFSSTTDRTGNGRDLTNSGVAFADPVATFGNNDALSTPDASDLDNVRAVAFWVRPIETRGMGLVCRGTTWHTGLNADQVLCRMYGSTVITAGAIPRSTWTHVACSISGSAVTLYINGTSAGVVADGTIADGSAGVTIGDNCVAPTDDELRGDMADVRLYRRPLTPADVAVLVGMPPP